MEDEGKDTTAAEIKEAHLQLDDIPPELLPIHQKKMCERVGFRASLATGS